MATLKHDVLWHLKEDMLHCGNTKIGYIVAKRKTLVYYNNTNEKDAAP